MRNLYLIEFYTVKPATVTHPAIRGWDINFAWVYAADKAEAKHKLAKFQGNRFDCVITCEQQAEISPLAGEFRLGTPNANLFIIN
jgi:hypothetical protein